MVIDGRRIADEILSRLKKIKPPKKILAAVLVGRNPASESFLKQKEKVARSLGIEFKIHKLQDNVSFEELQRLMNKLGVAESVGGLILQLPLPKNFNRDSAIGLIPRNKDVDALTGFSKILPPAAGVLQEILSHIGFGLDGKRAVVVGRGLLVGKPIADWLNVKVKKLTVFNSSFFDPKILKEADLVVSGVGKAGFIKGDMVKKGAALIDFGYSFSEGKLQGDFDFESCDRVAAYITKTPGGTGPILVAKLMENFFKLASDI